MKRFIIIIALMWCCCTPHDVNPNRPDGPIDCDKACENLDGAHCSEASPSPGGVPCEKWCLDYHYPRGAKGYMPPWAGCVAAAGPDAETIRSCGISCTIK